MGADAGVRARAAAPISAAAADCSRCRYDGNYFPNTEPISWLPEGTPAALQQQMSQVVGDFFYATLIDLGSFHLDGYRIVLHPEVNPHNGDSLNLSSVVCVPPDLPS